MKFDDAMTRIPSFVAALCLAEILSLAGAMFFPALQPVFEAQWQLSGTAAGWINGVYFAGYAAATPLLVGLTDRLDPRWIYLPSVLLAAVAMFLFAALAHGLWSAAALRLLAGIGLAGTYMPGLRALSDKVAGPRQSRYVAFYTASFSIGTAMSVCFAGALMPAVGWRHAAWILGLGPLAGAAVFAAFVPRRRFRPAAPPTRGAKMDRPLVKAVVSNRKAMGYVLAYAVHCWELFGYRSWLVAFLVFCAGLQPGWSASVNLQGVATVIMLLGVPASLLGNEGAMVLGRRRAISGYMLVSGVVGATIGFTAGRSMILIIALAFVYGITVMLDSGALTAGLVASAEDDRRGATMALYSFCGFGMAFLAPLVFGIILDVAGRSATGWGLAFAALGLTAMTGILWLRLFRRPGKPTD
ncbi:MAG: MFS transporter [Desulfobacterales bacterium]|nr:MFS transporter [Desulfobacteraceae bacterium]MDD3990640.1 MFS transporter [Desulfobacteraceae bacterium]MDY0311529.1 MFS transporter [Desulfobacterales bacterium]